ncbi:F-box domain-containing protein [Mycena kentingensis (nom. inval.)]|nr:F-box domain-containing protein [Mycena kentingensis (nom. inval.)]
MDKSPFTSLLHTNTVPSDSQRAAIRDFLGKPREEAQRLDAKVSNLQRLLEEASTYLSELRSAIHAHEALISPARRAPDDVLREIFLHTLPPSRDVALSADEGPLLLASICHRWREVALATPRLWSSMHIVVPFQAVKMETIQGTMARWIRRSGMVELSITMKPSASRRARVWLTHVPAAPSADVSTGTIVAPLLEVSRRWRTMQLVLSTNADVESLTSLTPEDVPILHKLHITYEQKRDALEPIVLPFLATSSLRTFTFTGNLSSFPTLNWPHLRNLELDSPTWSMNLSTVFPFPFLRDCTVLETFAITLYGYQVSVPEEDHTPIILTRLHKITLRMKLPVEGPQVFDLLHTPALRSLILASRITSNAATLFGPISQLRFLRLSLLQLTTSALATALDALITLEEIEMVGEPQLPEEDVVAGVQNDPLFRRTLDKDFLQTFLPIESETEDGVATVRVRCPALRRLKLDDIMFTRDDLILQVVRSRTVARADSVAKLLRFSLTAKRGRQLDLFAELGGAIAGGLSVRISHQRQTHTAKYSALEGTERAPNDGALGLVGTGDLLSLLPMIP